jgi:hypothetical protein
MASFHLAETLDGKLPYKYHKSITATLKVVILSCDTSVMTLVGNNGMNRSRGSIEWVIDNQAII